MAKELGKEPFIVFLRILFWIILIVTIFQAIFLDE